VTPHLERRYKEREGTMRRELHRLAAASILAAALLAADFASAEQIRLDVSVSTPVMLSGAAQRAYLRIGLAGFPIDGNAPRAPVNVAIVLDRSGSMSGEKLLKAKEAALQAIDRLGPEDIVSVVAYNHTVDVLVPATKVRDREEIYRKIESLGATGDTALFAGVSKGAREVLKFIDRHRANRVILLSDGLANVGPSSPGDLGDLGWSLARQGISVTTIGLGEGYNEDLMVALAGQSDGNHAFAENAADLSRIFQAEFGDVLSVIAREVTIRIDCAPGVRPIRVLGRRAEIDGRGIVATLNQMYAAQEKFVLVEIEVPAGSAGQQLEIATVDVRYANTVSRTTDVLGGRAVISFSNLAAAVDARRDARVLVDSVALIANEANKNAVALRDQGRVQEAEAALEQNAAFLEGEARRYKSADLEKRAASNRKAKMNMAPASWNKQRKEMADDAFQLDNQQAW
jgi:Ca-activated chloride channel homolog